MYGATIDSESEDNAPNSSNTPFGHIPSRPPSVPTSSTMSSSLASNPSVPSTTTTSTPNRYTSGGGGGVRRVTNTHNTKSPPSKTDFSQADEDVPFFHLGGERLAKPRHIREPVLNLGELVVEGATYPAYDDNNNLHDEPHGVFESFFDLTEPRLRVIFNALESSTIGKREGVADFQNLRRGLADAGVKIDDEEGFARLVSQVDQDLDGGLTFSEFEAVVQSLKMAYLLRSLTPEDAEETCGPPSAPKVRVMDYSVARVSNRSPRGVDLSAFLYSPRPEWATTRWIDVTSPSPFSVKGLAIKYRLHPLALEDALHTEFDQSAKIDRYSNHLFVVFPGMTLDYSTTVGAMNARKDATAHLIEPPDSGYLPSSSSSVAGSDRGGRYWRRKESRLRHLHRVSSSAGSVSQPLLYNQQQQPSSSYSSVGGMSRYSSSTAQEETLGKAYLGNDADDAVAILSNFPTVVHYNVCLFLTRPAFDTLITIVDQGAGGNVFKRVRNELQVAYSRLRSQNALFLMYTVLDVLVDQYSPIMDSFEVHINVLRAEVRENAARRGILFDATQDTDFLARYHDVVHELTKTKRRVSPAIRVLRHLTQLDEFDAECRIYLRDVLDHAEDVLERLESMMDECRSLKAEQQHGIDTKLTKSMAALTVVGVIFMPAQFLTGVFGMNFRHLPGIDNDYGYLMFWLAAICSWIGMYGIFRRYRVI